MERVRAHGSRTTLAYKQAKMLIGREFKVYRDGSGQKQPLKSKESIQAQDSKDDCAAVVALFFIIPLAAAGGLAWVISVRL